MRRLCFVLLDFQNNKRESVLSFPSPTAPSTYCIQWRKMRFGSATMRLGLDFILSWGNLEPFQPFSPPFFFHSFGVLWSGAERALPLSLPSPFCVPRLAIFAAGFSGPWENTSRICHHLPSHEGQSWPATSEAAVTRGLNPAVLNSLFNISAGIAWPSRASVTGPHQANTAMLSCTGWCLNLCSPKNFTAPKTIHLLPSHWLTIIIMTLLSWV